MISCEKVCPDCPFRKDSIPGWLGPHSMEEIMNNFTHEFAWTCHMKRDNKSDHKTIPVCKGFLISAKKSAHSFGKTDEGKKLNDLIINMTISEKEKDLVMNKFEFIKYHKKII
jgi:hypothetical protein